MGDGRVMRSLLVVMMVAMVAWQTRRLAREPNIGERENTDGG